MVQCGQVSGKTTSFEPLEQQLATHQLTSTSVSTSRAAVEEGCSTSRVAVEEGCSTSRAAVEGCS